jgi:ferredoxin
MKKLVIDPDLCIGCGSCVALAPNTFAIDDSSGKGKVINQNGDKPEVIQSAIDGCPVQAISWQEE